MNHADMKIIVIGAGIGGLTVARALALRGCDVTVLEQANAIREVGAGLQISPNGFVVLEALGLGEAVRAQAVRAEAVCLRDYRGAEVLRLDLQQRTARDYYFVHRADLIDILAAGASDAGAKIRLLQQVDRVDPGNRPRIALPNGASAEADLVIGADGLHSKTRVALLGTTAPFFTRQVAWRAVVPNAGIVPNQVQLFMAPKRHLVSYPLRGGRQQNIVAVQEQAAWAEESWNQEDDPVAVRAAFSDFCDEARMLVERIERVHLWGLFRHPVASQWWGDGVVLMGDAAHPTLPFMAQGACLAIEDAWVLAGALSGGDSLPACLAAYQSRREARVRQIVNAASGNAWKYHLSSPPVRWLAHQAMKAGGALVPDRMIGQFDWIYNYNAVDDMEKSGVYG